MYAALRPSPPPAGQSFRLLDLRSPAFGAHWHYHDGFELNAVLAGEGVRWIEGNAERFAPGDIVLVPPGVPHSWNSDLEASPAMSAAIVALFPAELLVAATRYPELATLRSLLPDAVSALVVRDDDGEIRAALRRLTRQKGADRLLGFLACLDLVARAPRRHILEGAPHQGAGERDRALIRRAIELIQAADVGAPRQSEVARELAVSPSRLSRLFRRATGLTYSAFVDAHRVARACSLLQNSERAIIDIAFAAGFTNLSNFNRRFRAAMGETPRDYRRRFEAAMSH